MSPEGLCVGREPRLDTELTTPPDLPLPHAIGSCPFWPGVWSRCEPAGPSLSRPAHPASTSRFPFVSLFLGSHNRHREPQVCLTRVNIH